MSLKVSHITARTPPFIDSGGLNGPQQDTHRVDSWQGGWPHLPSTPERKLWHDYFLPLELK